MSKPKIHVIFILDRSGSMASMGAAPATGFNEFVAGLKENQAAKYRLTLIQFDDQYEVVCNEAKLNEVPRLELGENYIPRASTALYDTLGRAITTRIHQKNVLLAVFTDGQENASNEFTHAAVEKLIKTQTQKGWDFNFISSDLGAVQQAINLGFMADKSFKVSDNAAGMRAAYATAMTQTANYVDTLASS